MAHMTTPADRPITTPLEGAMTTTPNNFAPRVGTTVLCPCCGERCDVKGHPSYGEVTIEACTRAGSIYGVPVEARVFTVGSLVTAPAPVVRHRDGLVSFGA